jgi:hypothetical protein
MELIRKPPAALPSIFCPHAKSINTRRKSEKAGRDMLIAKIEWILDCADKLEGLRDDPPRLILAEQLCCHAASLKREGANVI